MNYLINLNISNFAIARTFFALSQLITFNFTKMFDLFEASTLNSNASIYESFSIFTISGYDNLLIVKVLVNCALLLVIIGVVPPITSILHWWISFSFLLSSLLTEGGDQILAIMTLILVPLAFLFGFQNHWKPIKESILKNIIRFRIIKFVYFLISVQVCIVYFHAGYGKLFVPEWSDGSAIYYWLNQNTFGSSLFFENSLGNLLLKSSLFTLTFTWLTIIFEIMFSSLLLLDRSKRRMFWIYGFIFHFLILIFIGLASFSFAMFGVISLYCLPISNIFFNKKIEEKNE